jgi:hypothetical protein
VGRQYPRLFRVQVYCDEIIGDGAYLDPDATAAFVPGDDVLFGYPVKLPLVIYAPLSVAMQADRLPSKSEVRADLFDGIKDTVFTAVAAIWMCYRLVTLVCALDALAAKALHRGLFLCPRPIGHVVTYNVTYSHIHIP